MAEKTTPPPGDQDSSEGLPFIDQSDLDDLLSQFQAAEGLDGQAEDVPVGASGEVLPGGASLAGKGETALSQAALDALIAGADGEAALDGADPDAVLAEPGSLAAGAMDEVLGPEAAAGGAEPEAAGQDDIDALIGALDLGEAESGEPEDVLSRIARQDAEQDIGSENLAAAALAAAPVATGSPEETLVTDDMLTADTGKESVAAVSEDEMSEELAGLGLDETPAKEAKPDREAPAATAPPPGVSPRRQWGNVPRAGAAIAAGLVAAAGVFVYLHMHTERPFDAGALGAPPMSNLQRAIRSAESLLEQGRYEQARKELEPALAHAPSTPERNDGMAAFIEASYRALPETLTSAQTEELDNVMDDFLKTAPWHPRAPSVLRWKAAMYERTGLLTAARDVYARLIADFPSAPDVDAVLVEAAGVAMKLERPEEAAGHLRRALQQYPLSPLAGRAKLALGEALAAAGQEEEGKALLRQVAEANSANELGADAYARLGQIAYDGGRYGEAIAELEQRLQTALAIKGNEKVYLLLAKSYARNNQLSEAQRVLEELIQFFPDSPEIPLAFVELSRVLDDMGKRKDAIRLASQAVRRYPTNREILLNNAYFLELEGNDRGAGTALVEAYAAGATEPGILLSAGRYFGKASAWQEAREAFQQVLVTFPRSDEAFDAGIELARVFLREGRHQEALRRLDNLATASEGTPKRLPVLIAMADLYQEIGLKKPAADVYAQIASLTTEPEVLAKAALGLLDAGVWAEGLAVANRVEPAELTNATAYALLMAHGTALLRTDASKAVEQMARAYTDYPDQRTPEGNHQLLEAYLATGRTAPARVLVYELDARVRTAPVELPLLQRAANTWGDYLYGRRDFREAAEAYRLAIPPAGPDTDASLWAKYQRANALLQIGDLEGSIALFEDLAAGSSPWKKEAETKAEYARIEQRLRGEAPVPGTQQS